ncbi:hypothetical protein OG552_09305 [Streptomyces sp. NBC_01476]|uniref:COG4315 family predicted lipoprotein n=1 Tax=Streptomyces sp. NBC_01476 TaxID=2903881 RepID=UPI002E331DB0|nr:hypothetical protein [Streptomyces sp. NBC_01476]
MIITNRGRMATGAVFAASLAIALTACGSSGSSASSPSSPAASSSAPSPAPSAAGVHTTSDAKLGTIVVNGKGLTLYRFDNDTSNPPKSNCTGQCATLWPAAPAADAATVNGVDQKLLGSVDGTDGTKQLTLDGWPLYTFAQDAKPGDTNGQGLMGIWWAVTPTGAKAGASAGTSSAATSAPADSGSGGGSYGY